jgi:hypothetical protein
MKSMDRVEKENRAHAIIKVLALLTELFERVAFFEQLLHGSSVADRFEGAIPERRILRSNDLD